MTVMTVWLLAMTGYAHSGGLGAIQPHMFPTVEACEQVAKNAGMAYNWPKWRCIQTQVVVPK